MKKLIQKSAAILLSLSVSAASLSTAAFAADAERCPDCGAILSTETVSVEYGASVSKPTYKIKGSKGTRKIKLSTKTSGATIYYTLDGSTPTTSSYRYTGLITITKNTKIKAIAVKSGSSSAVMSKTVRIKTLLGDVTGDGNVNETDYTRLQNWINGSTSYGCKDNADVSGNGKINSTDLIYLRQYLDGDIDDFPAAGGSSSSSTSTTTSSSIKQPTMTVYKSYGGKKIKLETETSGATIYYTTNGNNPTTSSTKYTGTFILENGATVKAVAYKGGKYSTVKSRTVDVGQCDLPVSNMDDSKEYTDSVKITLTCPTADSRIYYTTDGSDPVRYGKLYSSPIELTANTTLKIFAEAKGCANSAVRTYNYKVKSTNFTISGVVWDDTTTENVKADGIKQYGEAGINGITVKLINTATGYTEQTVTTSTINYVAGSYVLDKAKANNTYKVTFEFNGQKYRPYGSIVSGGNQAIMGTTSGSSSVADLVIKNGGAYAATTGNLIAAVNSRTTASVSSQFTLSATTTSSYSSTASNVNLALASNVYGDLNLRFGSTSVTSASTNSITTATSGQKVYGNDTLSYTFTATNDSPYQNLRSAVLYFYLDKSLELQNIHLSSGSYASYSLVSTAGSGLQKYSISCPTLEANGGYVSFTVTAKVKPNLSDNTTIISYAEVGEYSFVGACYDKDSIPGNFNYAARESDEAASVTLYGYSDITASQTITLNSNNDYSSILVGTSKTYAFTITNGTGQTSDWSVQSVGVDVAIQEFASASNGVVTGTLVVTGRNAGSGTIIVSLRRDATKTISIPVTVVAATPAA
ncbi:MAG: chitobiase/beta-hexosaminidase C-terminal domain-containing protein [Bacteroides sp.]|nr:chitobiase/beta-hexosaminidase C-terminal domain-containing protein [Eubacterium sp.]MCM1419484.1 chitobiase/beta-hexosaminidase C-terminal domain-containing protein [Roseburia sp.]MCM1463347.1 chitobiase/beta-hexosaminidase C-terminal domain-containing protein [Bacteroides sp.]